MREGPSEEECEKSKELECVCPEGPEMSNCFHWPLHHVLGPSNNRPTFSVLFGTFQQGGKGGGPGAHLGCVYLQGSAFVHTTVNISSKRFTFNNPRESSKVDSVIKSLDQDCKRMSHPEKILSG